MDALKWAHKKASCARTQIERRSVPEDKETNQDSQMLSRTPRSKKRDRARECELRGWKTNGCALFQGTLFGFVGTSTGAPT